VDLKASGHNRQTHENSLVTAATSKILQILAVMEIKKKLS